MFFLRLPLIINYYLGLNYVLESRSLLLIRVLLMDVRCSFIFFTFLVIFALAILIFIVTILTLARSNNFVCIFLYLQRASLVGFFFLSSFFFIFLFDLAFFLWSCFFIFPFLSFKFLLLLLFLVLSLFHSFLPFFFCCSLFLSRTSLCFFPVYSSHTLVYYLCDCNNKSFCYFIYPAPLL